ncbi:MAG TPA: hypothetical protein PL126_04000 [Candidatus Cloacimonadota bacterium]|nr:hypothetical protein [Candidatus Cloacimonadota bacterium]
MQSDVMKALAKELATRINRVVDIPLISEENEQAFFEMVILMILDLIFSRMSKESL